MLEFNGQIRNKLKNNDRSEKSVSSSLICSFRSSLVDYYRQRSLKPDVVVVNNVEDFIDGYNNKIGQLKLSGVMSLVECKQPVTFEGYRFLALNVFSSSIFTHLFLLVCWNLMTRSVSVGSIMFAHMSWVPKD